MKAVKRKARLLWAWVGNSILGCISVLGGVGSAKGLEGMGSMLNVGGSMELTVGWVRGCMLQDLVDEGKVKDLASPVEECFGEYVDNFLAALMAFLLLLCEGFLLSHIVGLKE